MAGLIARARALKEQAVDVAMNHTPIERKVREATNGDEPWGPHGTVMAEIAKATFSYEEFPEAMGMLWRRLIKDRDGKHWRRIYKGLLLLNHLMLNGSDRVVESARDHMYDLRRLEEFDYIDPKGKDQGLNVRKRAKDLIQLLSDDEELREQRKKTKANRDKYTGIGNASMTRSHSSDFSSDRRGFEDDWDAAKKSTSGRKPFRDDSPTRGGGFDDDGDDWANGYKSVGSGEADAQEIKGDPFGAPAAAPPAASSNLFDLQPAAAPAADPFGSFAAAPAAAATPAADPFGAPAAAPAAPAADPFGSFAAAPAPAAAAPADAFGSFAAAPTPAAAPAVGVFGGLTAPAPAPAPALAPMPAMPAMGGGLLAPAAAPMQPSGGADLLGGGLGSAPAAAPATAASASKNTWSGLDINLDGLSLGGASKGAAAPVASKPAGNVSVFGDSLSSAAPAPTQPMGGMGMQQQQQQQPMGMMGGMQQPMMQQQPMGGMGMGMQQQPMGMGMQQQPMGGMGMQQQPMGMMGMGGMQQPMMQQQPMGGMGMGMQQQPMGMGMQQPGMGMQGGFMQPQQRR